MDFNKEFSNFKNRESEQLAKFGEGARIYRILGEIEMKRSFAKYFYEAGQQSKQAEIDKIKQLLKQWDDWISVSDGNNHIDIVKECADELRELLK